MGATKKGEKISAMSGIPTSVAIQNTGAADIALGSTIDATHTPISTSSARTDVTRLL
jgi:hypothetical protein